MRRLVLLPLVSALALAASAALAAQSLTASAASAAAQAATQKPAPPATPAPEPQPELSQSAPEEVGSHSLFEPTWRQFVLGGRITGIDGDPARFQRYQDERDGVYFSDAKYESLGPNGAWMFHATADNVGYRDQRYSASYERPGRVNVAGYFDQIPQFYSVDTHTPYVTTGGVNVLDDATQRAIQNGQATLSAYIPIAPQFDLRERRDIGHVNLAASVTPTLDLTAAFTTQAHVGQLPWGASFGFSNDVEVGVPYDSRANDFTIGAEWTKPNRGMFRVGYEGSWFDNHDDALVWDSPLRLDDSTSAPGRGRMQLWPSNSAQTVSAAGYAKFAHRSQLTGYLSIGTWSNDEPLQPFTINSALPVIPLPRATADAEARVVSSNLSFVSRPAPEWRFSSRFRRYDYNNNTPQAVITDYVSYDTSIGQSSTHGPELYAHDRMTFDADTTYTGLGRVAVTAGYTNNHTGYDLRIYDSTSEHTFYVSADAVGSSMVSFRTNYEFSDRTGSGLNEDLLTEIGEQPALRHYDLANRTRHKFSGQVDIVPNDIWVFSATAGLGNDTYPDSVFGLQDSKFRTLSLGADFRLPSAFGGGVTYTREHYDGLQRSRSAGNDAEFNSPAQDWTADSKENVDYFSIYLTPPPIARNTEVRFSYDYSYAEGSYLYGIQPGSTIVTPNQLPNVFNKLQQLHLDVRHRLSGRLAATFSYLYEPFRVYDFAFDPTVVNSIVQPSSLVLGYVYRPYTANSAVFGLLYHW